jgi:hypothetical protein
MTSPSSDDSLRKMLHNEFMRSPKAQAALARCVARLEAAMTYDDCEILTEDEAAQELNLPVGSIANLLISRDIFAVFSSHDDRTGRNPGVPSWQILDGKPLPGIARTMECLVKRENDHFMRAICFFTEKNALLNGYTPVEMLREKEFGAVEFAAGEWDVSLGRLS